VTQLWSWIFSTDPFVPHGFCLLWRPDLVWTHVASDVVIAAAYFTIPVFLITLLKRRRDIHFSWAFVAFATFILLCGATHVMSVIAFWIPLYGLEAIVKIGTALASVATAIAVWPLLPKLLALPSPAALQKLNAELEHRVDERTSDLRVANRNLEVLLKELHHRVKNNLQVIASMLRLKQRHIKDQDLQEVMHRTINRIHAMGLVHETLYSTDDFSEMRFESYLTGLVDHLKRSDPHAAAIDIEVEADHTRFDLDQSIPLGLIANEILSNALKHAFPGDRAGRIRILFKTDGARVSFEIIDNGIGDANKAASKPGLGLQIVQALTRQINGEATTVADAQGWRFRLVFERTARASAERSRANRRHEAGGLAVA
jgi:two-component sensor histidine kinase